MLRAMNRIIDLPLKAHATLALVLILWFQWAKGKLDASYVASQHPVDYMTGQTTFNGETVKGHYAAMSDAGTLDIYGKTQLIDFGFILGFIGIGLFVITLLARLNRAESLRLNLGPFAGLSFVLGAFSDGIENGWSFVMLANPSNFADWIGIAIPYSIFAVLKFGLVTLGLGLTIACLISAVVGRALRKPNIG